LEIKEKEEEEDERAFPLLLGAFSLLFISIMVWAVVKTREKKHGLGETFVICPGCGSNIKVTLTGKHQTIKCPICGIQGQVNK
jgi:uncharacterized paraquat-inducible protein A